MKNLLVFLAFSLPLALSAQMSSGQGTVYTAPSFIDFQRTLTRPADALQRREDTLQKQFKARGLVWPARYVYIRSFKYDSQFEVWVKNDREEQYKLFKTYKICALAGTLGPKRMEGDYQVPEGFYYINEFNARSNYHLSLGLNYPNSSDRVLSDSIQPGGEIYIHGSCVTVGCIPLTDPMIEEVYIIGAHAKNQGQDFIPVHIFPVRFNVKRSMDYFNNLVKDDKSMKQFASSLEDAFNYFERYKQLPIVVVTGEGEYLVNNAPRKIETVELPKVKRKPVERRTRKIIEIPVAVHNWPEYPGGQQAFMNYLDKAGRDMVNELPAGVSKAYVQVEFVVDWDGVPVNFKVLKGVNEEFDEDMITYLEKTMKNWKAARLNDQPVPKRMVQSITVAKEQ